MHVTQSLISFINRLLATCSLDSSAARMSTEAKLIDHPPERCDPLGGWVPSKRPFSRFEHFSIVVQIRLPNEREAQIYAKVSQMLVSCITAREICMCK